MIHIPTKSRSPAVDPPTSAARLYSSAARRRHRSDPRLNQRPPALTTQRHAAGSWDNFPAPSGKIVLGGFLTGFPRSEKMGCLGIEFCWAKVWNINLGLDD